MERPAGTIGKVSPLPGTVPETGDHPRLAGRFAFASGSQPLPGYTIKRGIGSGGFGEVYYALSDAGKEVALKHIQRNLEIELRGVRQCLNLKHPNLVALFDIRHDQAEHSWVVMEYVAGESLSDVIDRNPNGMPLEQIQFWFSGIAAGVQYLHDHGIVHRDLKPGNIFLDQHLVKIGDYGLSKFISCSRRSGHTESVGTFHYMAPEIGQGRYGKEIDIYALGIVLHEMLTGRVPFDGESTQEIIMKHLTAQPELELLAVPFRQVIGRALAKQPEDRYSSVDLMMADLGVTLPSAAATGSVPVADVPRTAAELPRERPGVMQVPSTAILADPAATTEPAVRNQPLPPGAYLPEPVKWVLLIGIVLLIITRAQWLLPIAVTLGTVYGFYLLFSVVLDLTFGTPETGGTPGGFAWFGSQRAKAAAEPGSGSPESADAARVGVAGEQFQRQQRERLRQALQQRSLLTRAVEIHGSALLSGLVAAILCFVMTVMSLRDPGQQWLEWMPELIWLGLPTVVGSWSLLALGKFWENEESDPSMRRFIQGLVGLAVGAFVGWLGQFLSVDPTYILNIEPLTASQLPEVLYPKQAAPSIYAFALYFGGLFLSIRWWRRTDPLRPHRISLWSTLSPPIVAVLLHLVLPIPRGFLFATGLTVSVQLAAPWFSERRQQMLLAKSVPAPQQPR